MLPGGRRGRTAGSTEESHLRDLSPTDTLRAFTETPLPYDASRDEYKVFACIDTLTPAERDLGARVAKAAQRLKSWCQEIEQWGWSGSFEPPSDEDREKRRMSLQMRIREHVADNDTVSPLEYWGSMLSVEVQAHEARLDDIADELLMLDIDELKEHVLDIYGPTRSRPSSAGFDSSRSAYTPMDDFSFLITQTLLSALPHHYQLKDRLGTWTARVSVLRDAPKYLDDLETAQTAMKLAWDAIEPPNDGSDAAFEKWKEAVDTISDVLQGKVSQLGQLLDRMLDTLEGRDDRLPDDWIDIFEGIEGDYGQWAHESRKRVLEFDVRRKAEHSKGESKREDHSDGQATHSHLVTPEPRSEQSAPAGDFPLADPPPDTRPVAKPPPLTIFDAREPPLQALVYAAHRDRTSGPETPPSDHSVFEEGDTVVHNEMEDVEGSFSATSDLVHMQPETSSFPDSPTVVATTEREDLYCPIEPRTPTFRRGSTASISPDVSLTSSPPSVAEHSPSVRSTTARQAKIPRPELNATIGKRRPLKVVNDSAINDIPPWPPTRFSKQPTSDSSEDLDQKISDILTTIPADIRLTTGIGADLRKPARGQLSKKDSKGYLRAARSINGMKSPELTLSPAKSNFDSANVAPGRRSAAAMRGDNDIKLYHLTQPGKEHPIKLFIRRVGENGERVMVRVGGGWADLGEYLRQYAEHHGRRTISEGKFEILGLEAKFPESSPRPESAMSKRDRRFSGGHAASPTTTPQKLEGTGISKIETPHAMSSVTNTPVGVIGEASAPSTDSSHQSWTGTEVGLAGPKAKKLDLSGEKLEWIEGMMKQARTVSGNMSASKSDHTPGAHREGADSRSESRTGARKSDFGDLGKVGGTKRLFLRSGGLSEH